MRRLNLAFQPTRTDYLFVLLLMCFSGNQAFTTGARAEPLLMLMWMCVVIRMIMLRRGLETRTFLVVTLSLTLILFMQALFLDYMLATTPFGFLIKLMIGAGVVSTVRFFRLAFVRVMVWLAVLSLVFHIPTVVLGSFGIKFYEIFKPIAELVGAQSSGTNLRFNILVHNFMGGEHYIRNGGIFWEPGAFSGYLIVALVLLASIRFDLPASIFKRWRRILVVTALSTLSTTGFLFLPFALFASRIIEIEARRDYVSRFLWVVLFLLLLVPGSGFLWQLDFMGPKIQELYSRAINYDAGWQLSRFGAVLFDWEHIQQRPFFGWSPADPERYSLFPWLERYATGNGFSGYLREMGVAGMLIFVISFWLGLGRVGLSRLSRTMIFSIIVFQLNGQSYMTYPFYLGLHFIGLELWPRQDRSRIDRLDTGDAVQLARVSSTSV